MYRFNNHNLYLSFQDVQEKELAKTSLESIVDKMLERMMSGTEETVTIPELKSLIFAGSEMDRWVRMLKLSAM